MRINGVSPPRYRSEVSRWHRVDAAEVAGRNRQDHAREGDEESLPTQEGAAREATV